MSSVLRSLVIRVGADITKFDKNMKAMARKMKKTGRTLTAAGATLTKGLTLPIIAIGVAAFKMGKDFEASMSKIEGLVGVASEQVGKWGKDILEMAPKLGKAPKELAEGLFFVTSAGIRGAAAMETLEIAAKGSAIGLGETAIIADALTSAMNAYGIENLNAAQAADILTAAVREGKLEASALAPVLGQLLPTASSLGISFSQMAGSLAVMSRTGADAATSATSLNQIMMFLKKPTAETTKMLDSMGLSMQQMRDMAKKEPDGLIKVMRLLNDTFADDEEALARVIPNVRAFKGVMNILAQEASIVDDVISSVANSTGILEEAMTITSQTAEFKWQQAMSGVQSAFITLWETLQKTIIPIIEKVSEKIQDIVRSFNALSEEQKANIVKWAGIAAAVGPVLLIAGKLLLVLPQLGAAIALLTGPIAVVIYAFAALVAATMAVSGKLKALRQQIDKETRATIANIEEERDAKIEGYNETIQAKKDALAEELRLAQNAHDTAISDLRLFRTDSINIEKKRLDDKLKLLEEGHDETISKIREEFGVVESTTKSKTDITNTYYDNLKMKANEAYNEVIKLINAELAIALGLLDDETRERVAVIQGKIDDINTLTTKEEAALKEQAEAKELASLEDAVRTAFGRKAREKAADELNNYLLEKERERLLTTRELEITDLEEEIKGIKENGVELAIELEEQAETDRGIEGETLTISLTNIETRRDAAIEAIQAERIQREKFATWTYINEMKELRNRVTFINSGTGYFIEKLDEEIEELEAAEIKKLRIRKRYAKLWTDEWEKYDDPGEFYDPVVAAVVEANLAISLAQKESEIAKAEIPEIDFTIGGDFVKTVTKGIVYLINTSLRKGEGALEDFEKQYGEFPSFAGGGIVPGLIGAPTLVVAHGGETITPAGEVGIVINANYNIIDKETAEFANTDLTGKMSNALESRGFSGRFR